MPVGIGGHCNLQPVPIVLRSRQAEAQPGRVCRKHADKNSGVAEVMGCDVARDPQGVRRRIGIVFQQQSIDGKLTATENLRHQGHLYGMSGKTLAQRVREMLATIRKDEEALKSDAKTLLFLAEMHRMTNVRDLQKDIQ